MVVVPVMCIKLPVAVDKSTVLALALFVHLASSKAPVIAQPALSK